MITITKNMRCPKGASLVGTLVAISVLSIAIIGAAHFRYFSALDSRRAVMHSEATRIAVMLNESWRAVNGAETYDPVDDFGSGLTITGIDDDIEYDETFTLLGIYEVGLNDKTYYAILSWKDVSSGLRALNIIVTWSQRSGEEDSANKSFMLTTYVMVSG